MSKRRFNRSNTTVSDVFYDNDTIQALIFAPDFTADIPMKRGDEYCGNVCVYVHPAEDKVELSYLMTNEQSGKVWLDFLPLTMEEECFLQIIVEEALIEKGE